MYQFTDLAPDQGTNFYRLRMIDLDGSVAFSPVRSVTARPAVSLYPTGEHRARPGKGYYGRASEIDRRAGSRNFGDDQR